jgi:hypothetical protein
VGRGRDAEIELLFLAADLHLQHDAAVLRQPLFADVELGHDLEARGDRVLQFQRRIHDQLQNSVNTEAHAEFLFVGLHVNVAGAPLHRIGEHQVHELDDGSFVGRFLQFLEFEFLLFGGTSISSAFAGVVQSLHHLLELFLLRSAVGLVDALDDRAFRGHDRFDIEAGHELDIVHGKDVGGVHHGDGERSADAAERQNLIALGGFVTGISLTTTGSISKYERLMAGTPYWRERKLVTSSSERKPNFTSAEASRVRDSFWSLVACSNCSVVMTFSLTSRSPSR